MGTIFSNTLETVAPIKLKKFREKRVTMVQQLYPFSQKKINSESWAQMEKN